MVVGGGEGLVVAGGGEEVAVAVDGFEGEGVGGGLFAREGEKGGGVEFEALGSGVERDGGGVFAVGPDEALFEALRGGSVEELGCGAGYVVVQVAFGTDGGAVGALGGEDEDGLAGGGVEPSLAVIIAGEVADEAGVVELAGGGFGEDVETVHEEGGAREADDGVVGRVEGEEFCGEVLGGEVLLRQQEKQ